MSYWRRNRPLMISNMLAGFLKMDFATLEKEKCAVFLSMLIKRFCWYFYACVCLCYFKPFLMHSHAIQISWDNILASSFLWRPAHLNHINNLGVISWHLDASHVTWIQGLSLSSVGLPCSAYVILLNHMIFML